MKQIVSPSGKPKVLPPVRPNARLASRYEDRLHSLIDRMHKSFLYWLQAQWRKKPPATLAMDEAGAVEQLRKKIDGLGDQWQRQFDDYADDLASYFGQQAFLRSDAQLKAILRRMGISVKFQMTRAANDALRATIAAQVGLIRTIPQQYLGDVQGIIMRSAQAGMDLHSATQEINAKHVVTRQRAAFIARDQNAKATATITRVRQHELGITTAKWLHSHAGVTPRPHHVAFSQGKYWGENPGPFYDVNKGMVFYDRSGKVLDGGVVFPGWAINCRCVSRPVIPGFIE